MASNNNIWDKELNSLLQGHETEPPEGLWDQLSESLEGLNHELEFDESLRNTVNDAQFNPPADVWNAVQTGLGKASLMSGTVGLITKVVVTSLVVAGGVTAWYFSSTQNNSEPALIQNVEQEPVLRDQGEQESFRAEREKTGETASEETIASSKEENENTAAGNDKLDEARPDNKTDERVLQVINEPAESDRQSAIDKSETVEHTSETNESEERESRRVANNNENSGKKENPVIKKQLEASFNISVEKKELCPGEKFKAYLNNTGNKKGYVILDGNRFLISGKEMFLELQAPFSAGEYVLRCFDVENNPIPGATVSVQVSSFQVEPFTITEKEQATFELKHANNPNIKESSWKIDHKESGNASVLNVRFSDKEISEHRVVLVQKNTSGCVDSVVGKIINKTTIAEPVVPNVFTPGGDGFNDEFLVKIEGEEKFLLMIYDDNGTLLFQSDDKNKGWDGINPHTGARSKGKHFAVLRYKLIGMTEKEIIGTFSILQP